MASTLNFRQTEVADDATTAEMFKSMWNGIGVTDEKFFIKDHLEHTLKFIEDARQHWEYRAFQVELDGKPIGTAACQVFHALYPSIIVGSDRKIGYIWGVYTAPEHRRQGIGRQLVQLCVDYLRSIDCTRATLHAAPLGKPVYSAMGFQMGHEMELKLRETALESV